MKIDGLDHPKTIDLADELGICIPQAIGHLELFWLFVGQKTPRGNVGRWSDAVIANGAQWSGKGSVFVQALAKVGYIDEHPEHRFIVHDWDEHMPRWVKAKLKREKKRVVTPDSSPNSSKSVSDDDSKDCSDDYSLDCSSDIKGREGKGRVVKGSEGIKTPVEFADAKPDPCAVTEVFGYWQQELGHSRAKLDTKRKNKIRDRLKDGYTPDELKAAVRGIQNSPHHMGKNDSGTIYDDIELICRDAKHVDQFVRLDGEPNLVSLSKEGRSTAAAAKAWLEEEEHATS